MDKRTCEPHLKFIYIYIYIYIIREEQFWQWPNVFFLFFIYLFIFLIHGVLTVGIRRAKNENSSTRRGLRVSTKKHGISLRIQVRSSENPKFRYFLRSTAF